jgi:hypothetical protein
VLLYNGGEDSGLLNGIEAAAGDSELLVHPDPRPLQWGTLHPFALDCMRFALTATAFDTMTIVDSDQLGTRAGYREKIASFLAEHPGTGMLGSATGPQPPNTRCAPALVAHRERELWRPFLRRFKDGERKFPHWTFWPTTVFTADVARDLVELVDRDPLLGPILERSRIWASEEVVLPTLVALLAYGVARNPCSHDLVKYRVTYTPEEVERGLAREDVFWIHPVPRSYDDRLRALIRSRLGHYEPSRESGLLLRTPILEAMRRIDGWLSDEEADLLIAATTSALQTLPAPHVIVEAGSYCGRATVVLGGAVKRLGNGARVHSIDPHDGIVGSTDTGLVHTGPTFDRFTANVAAAGVEDVVESVPEAAATVDWEAPISMLVIDGLHDYEHVSRDFRHFEPWLLEGALIAFHDFAHYFPGVVRFVDELLAEGRYERLQLTDTMILLRARGGARRRTAKRPVKRPAKSAGRKRRASRPVPMISCLMPTYNRHVIVPRAVSYFLRQDHPNAELIVIDDSPEPLNGQLPDDERIRHLRLDRRHSIGAKRNLGVQQARGQLLANWDDDDWYAPWRLSYQVERMRSADVEVCGLSQLLYLDAESGHGWRYTPPRGMRAWLADPTLVFTTDFWQRNPFPDTSMGIDCRLLWNGGPKRLLALEREEFFVGIMHPRNTSPKDTGHAVWSSYSSEALRDLMGTDFDHHRRTPDGHTDPSEDKVRELDQREAEPAR